jgi:hypothetical protein
METRRTVRNCENVFSYNCPKDWEKLETTGEASVRRCGYCKRNVHLCTTDAETIALATKGEFIARETPVTPVPEGATCAQLDRIKRTEAASREVRIDIALVDLKRAHRICPKCGFAVANFKKRCSVCRFEIGPA